MNNLLIVKNFILNAKSKKFKKILLTLLEKGGLDEIFDYLETFYFVHTNLEIFDLKLRLREIDFYLVWTETEIKHMRDALLLLTTYEHYQNFKKEEVKK